MFNMLMYASKLGTDSSSTSEISFTVDDINEDDELPASLQVYTVTPKNISMAGSFRQAAANTTTDTSSESSPPTSKAKRLYVPQLVDFVVILFMMSIFR